ncbi:BREX-1 system phosphatase PglZ type A [Virgibacillus sp. MSJ-26]|uniref:BREX-1 system phosphatase PglZ type A n=1 Tax=Virgibacillus sp. MSJ-26 TaxID=2841522 RepID=UPI001C0FBC44|nr:BREX-1 system phosphatase PglZ type A [Virgibacillus sp. MSJ-26]MBU5465808.1 BREX-1 system phosphatase PglZ type A [Virgibacillus sp. MSJ-26]
MNLNQIMTSLTDLFNEPLNDGENRKIVFWTDLDEEFVTDYERVTIDDVKVIHLHDNNQFYVKHLLEVEDTDSSYLVYTNLNLDSKDNWLYDTVVYSKTFYADRLSLIMNDLGIDSSLRAVVQKYIKFFDRKERAEKFKAFDIHTYTKETIELAMMNVLCGMNSLDFETVLRTMLMDTLDDENNRYLKSFSSYFDVQTFWEFTHREYDYQREEKTLKTLFIHMAVTAFSQTMDMKYLDRFSHFIAEQNKTNCYVFIDHWMHHTTDYQIFHDYVHQIEGDIQLPELIRSLPVEAFQNAEVFPYVDRAVIIYIVNSLMEQREDYEDYIDLISVRRPKHFYHMYQYIYDALFYAVKMHAFHKRYSYGIPQEKAIDMYNKYTEDYYLMDTYYRKFYVAFDAEGDNEVLHKLKSVVENLYTNWFMGELSTHWSQAVNQEMTDEWTLPGVHNQQSFYTRMIKPHLDKNERAFVIISDAMRYEVGKELQERLNSEILGECELDTMLSVVPSVTKFGMAALLPHREVDIDEKGSVLANGMSTSGIENRKKVLSSYSDDSIAVHFKDILMMDKATRRATFKGKKLIYIYHDTIDAFGDKRDTEMNTFDAAEDAIEQLSDLVRIIRNDLSGTHIYLTADHGFLYQRDPLKVSDLMDKESPDAFEISRRYILSKEQREVPGQLTIDLSSVIKNDQELFGYVPNATIRYRIQGGGDNFVHGGASLQEVVVPLLKVRNKRTGQRGAVASEKVAINLTSTTRRITNSIFSLEFFQNEKISGKHIPRSVVVYMADDKGNVLSNEERIIGDLTSDNPIERVFKQQFVLKNMEYDRNKTYYLVIKDLETDAITERIPFTINLSFISDFDF